MAANGYEYDLIESPPLHPSEQVTVRISLMSTAQMGRGTAQWKLLPKSVSRHQLDLLMREDGCVVLCSRGSKPTGVAHGNSLWKWLEAGQSVTLHGVSPAATRRPSFLSCVRFSNGW